MAGKPDALDAAMEIGRLRLLLNALAVEQGTEFGEGFAAGVAARNAELAEKVRGLPLSVSRTHPNTINRLSVLALLDTDDAEAEAKFLKPIKP